MGRSDLTASREATRNVAFAIAAFAGMLAVLATVPFRLARAWIAERTARVAESNLITDLINKAVEGLGAEKSVSRIGRPVTVADESTGSRTEIQWRGDAAPEGATEFRDWQTFDTTEPNLEVRIGAILTLERIARDNSAEHVRVMDILCAYIRENAKASDAKDHGLGDWPDRPEGRTPAELDERRLVIHERGQNLNARLRNLSTPRTDIQTALEVIGRRSPDHIAVEDSREARYYRLDLRETDLRRADILNLNLDKAFLIAARLEGAYLGRARLEGAVLRRTRLVGADLREADLRSAVWADVAAGAPVHSADLRGAKGLTQAQLDAMIGDAETLLPETLQDGSAPSIPSGWATPPPFFEAMIQRLTLGGENTATELRAQFLCPEGEEPTRTGTPMPLDAPRPEGHPLGERDG